MAGFLPLCLSVEGQQLLVVGGGPVATSKSRTLSSYGAEVSVVAPELSPGMRSLASERGFKLKQRKYRETDLAGADFVIAATRDKVLNASIAQACHQRKLPINVATDASLCSFTIPAIIERGLIKIAISTDGAAPVLASVLKRRLEAFVPKNYGLLVNLVGTFRQRVRAQYGDVEAIRRFWRSLVDGPVGELMMRGREGEAQKRLEQILERDPSDAVGIVHLVGAGPGDPHLLTFQALRLLQQCDALVYDRLVSKAIIDLAPEGCERFYVGKSSANHSSSQEDINELLVRLGREGRIVVRLKGGDPFIFARGGEEIEALAQAGIDYQIVPGITAANGCAAYAGIPLTHRDLASACVLFTARPGRGFEPDWPTLARPHQTLVAYMGLEALETVSLKLIEHGLAADTPAALIVQGTTSRQQVLRATLANIPQRRSEAQSPSLLIVGHVAAIGDELAWRDQIPQPVVEIDDSFAVPSPPPKP